MILNIVTDQNDQTNLIVNHNATEQKNPDNYFLSWQKHNNYTRITQNGRTRKFELARSCCERTIEERNLSHFSRKGKYYLPPEPQANSNYIHGITKGTKRVSTLLCWSCKDIVA